MGILGSKSLTDRVWGRLSSWEARPRGAAKARFVIVYLSLSLLSVKDEIRSLMLPTPARCGAGCGKPTLQPTQAAAPGHPRCGTPTLWHTFLLLPAPPPPHHHHHHHNNNNNTLRIQRRCSRATREQRKAPRLYKKINHQSSADNWPQNSNPSTSYRRLPADSMVVEVWGGEAYL